MTEEVELVFDARAELLEGPLWDERSGRLACVDIPTGAVHFWDRDSGAVATVHVGQPVGAIVPRASGGFVVAVRDGIAALRDDGGLDFLADIEADVADNLMNDAKCDPSGRLWAGTLAEDERPGAGALYRVDADHRWQPMLTGTTVSNGLGWSPDGARMYYVDSATQRIDEFRFDPESGGIADRRVLATVSDTDDVVPDGLTVDVEGCIWVALWGGGAVRRYTPDGGLDGEVRLPVAQVTSCAFGGPAYDELFVTTAAYGLDDDARAAQPSAGGLFRCRPGVKGTAPAPYAG